MASTQGLRYSPVNWLIVDWAFPSCGLPQPQACPTTPTAPTAAACGDMPMVQMPDTYDWARFLPNMQEGLEDPNDDICADKVREAAIDFARKSWVLQRELTFVIQEGVTVYPALPLPGERIAGVIAVKQNDKGCTPCGAGMGRTHMGVEFIVRHNGIEITSDAHCLCRNAGETITVLVYAVPTEDACAYDVMLYDEFRSVITAEARRRYVRNHYYKDRALMQSQSKEEDFDRHALIAKRRAVKPSTVDDHARNVPSIFHGSRPSRSGNSYAQHRSW